MGGLRILYEALLFAYPVVLCATLFISKLSQFVRQQSKHVRPSVSAGDPSRLYGCIWWLQAFLSLIVVGLVVVDVRGILEASLHGDSSSYNAQLASNISILLYFVAGLLPDPDTDFRPGTANLHSWIVAAVFDVVLIVIQAFGLHDVQTNYQKLVLAGSALRLVLLTLNSILFLIISFVYLRSRDDEPGYEPIVSTENGTTYGSIAPPKAAVIVADAQSTGWLNYFVGFRRLFPYFWPSDSKQQQLITVFCFVLLIAQRAVNILVPYQLGVLVKALSYGTVPYKELILYCVYRSMQGQQGLIGSGRAILWIPISQNLFRRLTCAAYEHIMMLSLDFHLSKRIGEVMTALAKGGALNTFLDGFAFQLFPMVLDLGIAAVFLFITFNALYSIITVGVLWSYVFVTIYMAVYRGRQRRIMALKEREMAAAQTDTIMAYETVHQNGALPLELARFADYVRTFQTAEFSVLFSLNALNALQNSIFILGVVLVAILSAWEISVGTADVASFVTIITYFAQLQAPLAFFGSFYNQVQNNLVDAERMLDLFNKIPDVQDKPNARQLGRCVGELEFKDVSFSYEARKAALRGVSFKVAPGTTTALVGESGSGKSTCMKLIFRFYDVNGQGTHGSGSITLDGHDLRDVTMYSLRQNIGVVPQETALFNETLMYNLRYGRPEATDAEVYEACRVASIHAKILTFPDGYSTVVGERGMKLSGGEKQRIAIARAILKNPALMLLDEATASLDSQTERLVQDALYKVTTNRSTVIIAHRLSTITRADQILVMHAGEIVERGTHRELLARRGRYAAMWEKQTKEEEEEGEDGGKGAVKPAA